MELAGQLVGLIGASRKQGEVCVVVLIFGNVRAAWLLTFAHNTMAPHSSEAQAHRRKCWPQCQHQVCPRCAIAHNANTSTPPPPAFLCSDVQMHLGLSGVAVAGAALCLVWVVWAVRLGRRHLLLSHSNSRLIERLK